MVMILRKKYDRKNLVKPSRVTPG